MVVGQGMRLVAAGVVLGSVAALLAGGALASLLFEVEPQDLPTLAGAATVLVAAGLFASYLPARRATLVDPVTALKGD
jgi:putative ABC transport system permease protein